MTTAQAEKAAGDHPEGIVCHLDLPYAKNHPKQKLDVFRPRDNRHAPLIVFIHGGGWFRGERAWTYQNAVCLAQNGYAVADLGYRLVSDYPDWKTKRSSEMWENMKSDLMSGLEYLVDHANELGIDASQAIVTGSSAGGHLCLAVRGKAADWVKQGIVGRAPKIVAAVAHCPVCDLSRFSTGYCKALKAGVAPEDIDPMFMDPKRFEGSLIVIGEKDPLLPHSVGFVKHLRENAVDVKLAILPGVAHGYIYGLGLDVSLSPIGKWVYPPSGPAPEHGQMGFDAAMACIKRIPGYDLPYRPFYEPTPYEYYDLDAPRTEGAMKEVMR